MNENNVKPLHDEQAETNILCSILFDNSVLTELADSLTPEDFYNSFHSKIYSSILELYNQSVPIDSISLKSNIKGKGKKLIVEKVEEIEGNLPLITNIKFHTKIIKNLSTRRKLVNMAIQLVETCRDDSTKLEEILDKVESDIFNLSVSNASRDFIRIKEFIIEAAEKIINAEPGKVGISTGFPNLDKLLGGFGNGDLVILAARPSVGKSSAMLEIVRSMSVNKKMRSVIFSLEMSKEQILDRLLSLQSEINLMQIRMGMLDDLDQFQKAASDLLEAEVFIDDTPGLHINELRSKVRKLNMKEKIDVIFVDYLQLIKGSNRDSRALEVTEISQGLKNLARELNIPVVALSQLNRALESRSDKKPQLSDLRESGSIEQDADIVIFIHREAIFNRELEDEERDKAEFIIAKHRNGATGIITLKFIPEIAKFCDILIE